ncbi:MAG TPA: hypothetical protein VFX65_09925 [Candidatus Limnocylindrales bacterium]|nr:hypothetical protein [Candidatus Limnocylindrales bacterium]
MHRRLIAALLSLGLVAGCGEPAPTPQLVAITTEAAPASACMEALITGVLVPHAEWGIALQTPGTGELSRPVFPFGYRAAVDGGGIALVDEDGRLVARTGDLIRSSGGFIDGEGHPLAVLCDDTIEVIGAGG